MEMVDLTTYVPHGLSIFQTCNSTTILSNIVAYNGNILGTDDVDDGGGTIHFGNSRLLSLNTFLFFSSWYYFCQFFSLNLV